MIWREIKIASSQREVRVIEGSSYRESTVVNVRVGASVDSACQHWQSYSELH